MYGIPVLLWRDESNTIQGVLDVCPHKKAPLNVAVESKNHLRCSYHGWEFAKEGNITNIPSSPHLNKKLKCKLHVLEVQEKHGFIWLLPNRDAHSWEELLNLRKQDQSKWKEYVASLDFQTDEESLIENFMDATHTPVVHDKIIRDDSKKSFHSIKVKNTGRGVIAYFGKTVENVWWFLSSLIYKKIQISHSDEFILPNIVLVKYYVNDVYRFQACIACTPVEQGNTRAFLRIQYNFWYLNSILKLILPFVAKKVLKQDFDITKEQYENREIFSDMNDTPIDYDYIHNQVHLIRKKIKEWKEIKAEDNYKNITLRV